MSRSAIVLVLLIVVVLLVFLALRHSKSEPPLSTGPVATPTRENKRRVGPGVAYPRFDLTPGAVDPSVTQQNIDSTICVPGYTKTVRPSERTAHKLKLQIMEAYDNNRDPRDFELDHFIPLELGGCPDCVPNLWPEAYAMEFGAHEKDRVENYLHLQVCTGKMTLDEAQREIGSDWVEVYNRIVQK